VQTRSSDNTTITTQYFGKVYEQIKQNTNTEHKHFIGMIGSSGSDTLQSPLRLSPKAA
jgi:hypothetical protein